MYLRVVTARKEHECSGCGKTIKEGTKVLQHYAKIKGKPENDFFCPKCIAKLPRFKKVYTAVVGV